MCACEGHCPKRPEVLGPPGAGVTGCYEVPDVGAVNTTHVCGNSMCS